MKMVIPCTVGSSQSIAFQCKIMSKREVQAKPYRFYKSQRNKLNLFHLFTYFSHPVIMTRFFVGIFLCNTQCDGVLVCLRTKWVLKTLVLFSRDYQNIIKYITTS